ncbi:hypothetical protein [Xenorhabdus bharatensis]|uniref:hypothetical protein n=1 Tax=Xenorhabdus bharatensis TaxID=3136256 RepID=UPI0030F3BABD
MADGSKRKVEYLHRGDIVLSKDGKILRIKIRIVGFDNNFIELQYKHDGYSHYYEKVYSIITLNIGPVMSIKMVAC